MQLRGYYSLTNLKSNSGNVGWPLPRENRNSGPFNDFFLKLAMGYDKEQMRQTILKHDSIFRHQLRELHRIYRIQLDLMNEIKSKEGKKHLIPQATSPSNAFSRGFKKEDERKRWQTSESNFSDLNCFRLSTSGANGIHSQFSSLKGNAPQSDSNYSSKGEATTFDLNLKGTCGFSDLSEPIPVEEASSSACVGIPSSISCSKMEVQKKDLSSMSPLLLGFNQRGAEVFQEPGKAKERWISLINPDLGVESRQNGRGFSNKFENGRPRSNGSFRPEDLHAPGKSVQVETTEARFAMFLSYDQNKRETFGKQKIFGIEIPEKSNGASTVTSHGLDLLPVHSWSDAVHSEILSVSSWAKLNGTSSQNGSWTYGQLNTSSTALLQDHDITRGKLLVDNNSRSLPSFRTEGLARNDFFCASDCKEPRACSPLVGFCNQNGIASKFASEEFAHHGPKISVKSLPWMMEEKSTIDLNATTMAAEGYEIEEISRSDFASVSGSMKQNSNGGLSWLRTTIPSNAKPNNNVEDSRVGDAKHRKSDTSYSSSSTKLLGFSVSENICRDLPLPNTPLKPSSPASAIDGVTFDMIHGSSSRKYGQKCPFEGMATDTSSVNPNANAGRIDLNLCVTEEGIEDIHSTSSSVRTNVRIAEMPVEMGTKDTSDYEPLENNLMKPSNLLRSELSSVSVAAEALIAISSSSCVINLHQNVGSDESELSASDSLLWFAEIVTSCRSDTENDVRSADGACLDDSITDGIDIFEFMTLNLKETEVDECCHKPQVQESKKSKGTPPRRSLRGQARRGRQWKDFQRDVLPNLTSLSRNEMTEDFHMIEGLIRTTGGSWQSSLTQKHNAKGKSMGRGRKREAGSAPPTMTEKCSNQFEQTKTGVEQTSLTGWGKRTRRLPRPRCLISSPPLAIK
ncbi:hypothetical protein V6N13_052906 [Hibiscus sabdariffa]